jgi:hypothetical protein
MTNRKPNPKASTAGRRTPRRARIQSAIEELILAEALHSIEQLDKDTYIVVVEIPSLSGGKK